MHSQLEVVELLVMHLGENRASQRTSRGQETEVSVRGIAAQPGEHVGEHHLLVGPVHTDGMNKQAYARLSGSLKTQPESLQ